MALPFSTLLGLALAAAPAGPPAPPKPTLYVFGYPGCVYCAKLEAGPMKDPAVTAALAGYRVEHVDGVKELALRERYKVTLFPTLVAVGTNNRELGQLVGYHDAPPLARFLATHAAEPPAVGTATPDPVRPPKPKDDPTHPPPGLVIPKGFHWGYLPNVGWGLVDDKIDDDPPPLPATGDEPPPPKRPARAFPLHPTVG